MPPPSRFESLPAELLSCVLTRCSRDDLVSLTQTCSNLHVVCRKELTNYPLTMKITSDSLKSWVTYCRKKNTPLTRGTRSLDITIDVTMQDLFDACNSVGLTLVNVDGRSIHPDAAHIIPLPSSLRTLSLKLDRIPGPGASSDILLRLLLHSLPDRCPRLEEFGIQGRLEHPSDEIDRCIRRLTHLRKLHLHVLNLSSIPDLLSLLPASLTELYLLIPDLQTQEDMATTVTWVRRIRKIAFVAGAPRGIANVLRILSRGGATHLTELILREFRAGADPAAGMSLPEALTASLQELSLLQPPLRTLGFRDPSSWSDSLHLPLLHTAVVSTLTQFILQGVDSCIFPSHLPWPRLQSLHLINVSRMGYQGPLTQPIFPALTTIAIIFVDEIQAPEDLFPALDTIKWQGSPTPEQVASLVRHDIKHIDMTTDYTDDLYESLWKAMGGHTIDLVTLEGRFSERIERHANDGGRIFPEFPNIREFALWGQVPHRHRSTDYSIAATVSTGVSERWYV